MSAGWTDERIEQLRVMWAEGLSASQIARTLGGVTRNAVIGIVHRRGFSNGRPQRERTATARPYSRTFRSAPVPIVDEPILEPIAVTFESGARVTIANVTHKQCRWPHGDPQHAEFHLCGNETLAGSVYCLAHSRKAYTAGNPRPKRDDATEELAVIARAERVFA